VLRIIKQAAVHEMAGKRKTARKLRMSGFQVINGESSGGYGEADRPAGRQANSLAAKQVFSDAAAI
jgi:hypothetical protein